tara:strand:+ start:147 stop:443 length:297 start_codon:yes stop_codon:yes gene_type:complete
MKVLKDFNNKLCDRIEYTIEVNHLNAKTPTKEEIKKKISEITKSKENLISLKGIYTKYGFGKSVTHAYVYGSEESFKYFEIRNKKTNGKKKKTKKQSS